MPKAPEVVHPMILIQYLPERQLLVNVVWPKVTNDEEKIAFSRAIAEMLVTCTAGDLHEVMTEAVVVYGKNMNDGVANLALEYTEALFDKSEVEDEEVSGRPLISPLNALSGGVRDE